jgi:hypothetical protein
MIHALADQANDSRNAASKAAAFKDKDYYFRE